KRKEQVMAPKILPDAGFYEPAGGVFKADSVPVIMQNPNNQGTIRYTLNAEVPTLDNSEVYKDTFYLKGTAVLKAAIFEEGVLQSTLTEGNFRIVPPDYMDAVEYQVYYVENIDKLPDFSNLRPVKEGHVTEFSHKNLIGDSTKEDQIAVVFESLINIAESGRYKFFTNSDDGSKLYVNGDLVVDNDGDHGVRERSGSIQLNQGQHKIRVEYFNGGGGYHLDVKYQGPNIPKQILPANQLVVKK
ncbi:MAG: PA14 domain-containing protein, partial [Allomuricauda sp.]